MKVLLEKNMGERTIRVVQGDITERDIEMGWKALDQRLTETEAEFAAQLGEEWVRDTHAEFADNIKRMRAGLWGNGRIVAVKVTSNP